MKLVDSHCHLHFSDFDERRLELIKRAQEFRVAHMLLVSIHLKDAYERVLPVAQSNSELFSASVGLHPCYCDKESFDEQKFNQLAKHEQVVAIGETGLDFFPDQSGAYRSDEKSQRECFARQIDIARTLKKPLIIHTRESMKQTEQMLRGEKADEIGGVMHCFTGNIEEAKRFMDLNFLISFSGIVTFKNAPVLQQVASMVPDDMMLIETDCPYLAPTPHRGKQNEPGFVSLVAEFVADLRKTTTSKIAALTTANFRTLFLNQRKDISLLLS